MKERMLVEFFAVLVCTFAATVLILRYLIPVLKSKKIGQKIYDIGPRWHKGKEGTPIMGGVAFIAAALIAFAVVAAVYAAHGRARELAFSAITLGMALANGLIGFFDDYTKLIKKQNQGFKAWQKLALQLAVASFYVYAVSKLGFVGTVLHIPYFGAAIDLGFGYYVVCVLLVAGMVNAVNLTDGIDGLSSSVTAVVAAFFSLAAFALRDSLVEPSGLVVLGAATLGGTVGFLMYNFYPAKIFMGDTGSLFLGGAVVGMAFLANEPLIVIVAGIVYVVEVASDIIQVVYFKLTHGKRIFKMAPIHHHFEKCGWSEVKIVTVFTLVTLAACVLAWLGIK